MAKRKGMSKEARTLKLLLLGTALALLMFFTVSLITAFITNSLPDPLGSIGIAATAVIIISALISGSVNSYISRDIGVIIALLSSLLFSLLMLLVGFIGAGGKVPLSCLINYGIFIAVSSLSAIGEKKLARKRHKRR